MGEKIKYKEHRPHELKRKEGKRKAKHYKVFVDTETRTEHDEGYTVLVLGVCFTEDSDEPFIFHTVPEFHDWLYDLNLDHEIIDVYAHNMRGFDALILQIYTELPERGYHMVDLYSEGSYFSIFAWGNSKRPRKQLYFIDSLNFYKGSLEKIGENLHITTKKVQIADDEWDTIGEENPEKLEMRCVTDTQILKEMILLLDRFMSDNRLGPLKLTVASTAFNTFFTAFFPTQPEELAIFIHDQKEILSLERASYYGGRTEMFQRGHFTDLVYDYDINSMYPSVMTNNFYPVRLNGYYKNAPVSQLKKHIESGQCVCARVLISTPPDGFNYYPVRDGKILKFVTGEYEAALCTPELKHALKHGFIKKVIEHATYDSCFYLFNDYINFFYDLKKNGDPSTKEIAKLFLNSLYGKFGQLTTGYVNYENTENMVPMEWIGQDDEGITRKFRRVAGLVQKKLLPDEMQESYNSFPVLAAHVTSYARVKLLDYLETAGYENVFYCDTDSLFCNQAGSDKMLAKVGETIGMIKVERVFSELTINNLKDYKGTNLAGQPVRKLKGVSKQAREITDLNELEKLVAAGKVKKSCLDGMSRVYEMDNFMTFHAQLVRQDTRYVIDKIYKDITGEYLKGIVLSDGKVLPFVLGEKQEDETA